MRFTGPASQVKKCPLDEGGRSPFGGWRVQSGQATVDGASTPLPLFYILGLPQGACLVSAGEAAAVGKD
jgi:hypothetical protein